MITSDNTMIGTATRRKRDAQEDVTYVIRGRKRDRRMSKRSERQRLASVIANREWDEL